MHGVSGTIGDYASHQALAQQREIANQVQNFVSDKFIAISQRSVAYATGSQHDHVLLAGAADQPHIAHSALVVQKSEGTRRRHLPHITIAGEFDRERFLSDGLRKIDVVGNRIPFAWIDADELFPIPHLFFTKNAQISPLPTLPA